ncbi:hypothetical protein AKJ51_00015 [candidate division MSBL1 archaeon SCGC-AAA382A20]|uniref:TRAM domain-containing protein n=1 Tax=candidate division MSBL1 archaeon SCGC-AAA382A20 TaxID=1698280 RepID=A0A133VMY6_9EURY|nr:hypothetical protein AKJ51_00015 [candidate division MSBL1 archaeon SCGC-AAA382A20]
MRFHEDKVRDEIIKKPPVSEGDTREVKIVDKGEEGDGIAKIGESNFTVIIPDTALDEKVKIEIIGVKPTFAFGEKIES